MRHTLGLLAALPATLILVAGLPTLGSEPLGDTDPSTGAAAPPAISPRPGVPPLPTPLPATGAEPAEPAEPSVTGSAPPAGEVGDVEAAPPAEPDAPTGPERSGEGFLVVAVPDSDAVVGSGPRWRYSIEVDPSTGLDPEAVARQIRAALTDERSWVRERTLEQVAEPARARIRIVVATPDTVDELCARAGLRTVGIYSCWNGRVAALNAWRWEVGADGFTDIASYRTYLVNHEVGHGFGYGHVGCPAPGAVAPVMMQQSKGLDGCIANGWPYP